MSNTATPLDPFRDPVLRAYLDDVLEWHGYVRALGLPTMKDNPSVPISQLYVAPALSTTQISPDSKELPEGEHVLQTLEAHRRLVVLGNPGSGKSTLVNWLAWRLAAGLSSPLPEFLQGAIPIPLILRELSPESMESFDKLLASFIKRPVAQAFNHDTSFLVKALKSGKALVLVDGLDELPEHQRQLLIISLKKAFAIYKKAIWLITSRIVGFDEKTLHFDHADDQTPEGAIKRRLLEEGVPAALLSMLQGKELGDVVAAALKPAAVEFGKQLLNELSTPPTNTSSSENSTRALLAHGLSEVLPENERRPWRKLHRVYVMPFDDKRIDNFSRAWYQVRGSAAQENANCDNFIRSVRANHATHTLARNPQILTLMALVFRTRLDLPQGRALLYEYITQAYLESIDQAYGILDARFTWQEKKRLLSKVGFEMQFRRVANSVTAKTKSNKLKSGEKTVSQGILFSESEVKNWIIDAMRETRSDADDELASAFLDHISKRSGLLLPRGQGLYAFVHLTFQEYFAALYLRDEICSPEFVEDNVAVDERISKKSLYTWSGNSLWHEALLFLHELVGSNPRWAKRIASWIFGSFKPLSDGSPREDWNRLALRVLISDDIHTGLDEKACLDAFNQACESLEQISEFNFFISTTAQKVIDSLCKSPRGSDSLIDSLTKNPRLGISLNDCRENFEKLTAAPQIFENTSILGLNKNGITNLNFLSNGYKSLIYLKINEPLLENIDGVSNCDKLVKITLNCPVLSDITPLLQCKNLRQITIEKSNIKNLSNFINKADIIISGDLSHIPTEQSDILTKRAKEFAKELEIETMHRLAEIENNKIKNHRPYQRGAEATRPPKRISKH